ncbi:MAG: hypothetical protein ACXVNM_03355 [Bacteroidia bacterium]
MKTNHYKMWAGVFLLFALSLNSQNKKNNNSSSPASTGGKCFGENTKILNLGIGFLGTGYYNYSRYGAYTYRNSPALSISYEQALHKKLGPGYLGLGAYFGYQSAYYQYNDYYYNGDRYYYKHSWKYMMIAARGAYHADILNFEKGELYFGAIIGLRIQTYNYYNSSPDPNKNDYALRQGSVYPGYSLFVGGRYYFTDNIGLFGELGYGISYLTLGLSLKF